MPGTIFAGAITVLTLLPLAFAVGYLAHSLQEIETLAQEGAPPGDVASRSREARMIGLVLLLGALGAGGIVANAAADYGLAPVRRIVRALKSVASGEFSERAPIEGLRETREIAGAVNEMARALDRRERELIQAEKLSAVGTLVAGVAHEINNPLAYLKGNEELLLLDLEDALTSSDGKPPSAQTLAAWRDLARTNLEGINRIAKVCAGLKQVSSPSRGETRACNLHDLLEGCLLVAHSRLRTGITVRRFYGNVGKARAEPADASQVFLNLFLNAADAMPQGGVLTLRTREGPEGYVLIEVVDTGTGMSQAVRGRVFEAFFTTKAHGTGLGLNLSRRIVEANGGSLSFETSEGKGTTFRVLLPRA